MNDKELFKKLNNLKDIKPDQSWKQAGREILYSQISASRPALAPKSNIRIVWEIIMPRQILIGLAKPVWVSAVASVLIMVVGLGSVYAAKNSKPGDSLYIAKIISEKAQFVITFNEKDKAKLGVEFATNRAKEMKEVLKDSEQTAQANNDKLNTLSQNFKKEISQVKNRLTSIQSKDLSNNDESQVFGANAGKSDQRMEISEPNKTVRQNELNPTATIPLVKPVAVSATSTPEIAGQATPNLDRQAGKMLDEAEKLVDEKNIDGAINKLEEVNKVIDQSGDKSDSGQVRGVSETATSTK